MVHGDYRDRYEPSWVIATQARKVHWLEQETAGEVLSVLVYGCGAERIRMGCYAADEQLLWIARQLRFLVRGGQAAASLQIELLAGLAVSLLVQQHPELGSPGVAAQAQAILDAEYWERVPLTRLAARLHVSAEQLRRCFRRDVGESISRYLLRRRMAAAQELLQGSQLPIMEVARLCGVPDQLYFSRLLHRLTGVAPSQWRQRRTSREAPTP